jgi:hypothetical protein
MAQEGEHACKMDVEDPTCWKLTLTGKVVPVPADQRHYAEKVLFSKYVPSSVASIYIEKLIEMCTHGSMIIVQC